MANKTVLTLFVFCLLFFSFFTACTNKKVEKHLTEGKITYSIEYTNIEAPHGILANVLPSKMVTHFTNNAFGFKIEGAGGLFKIIAYMNANENSLTHAMRVMDKKYSGEITKENMTKVTSLTTKYKIKHTNNTKMIAGILAKEAIVTIPHEDGDMTFKAYYTDEINIDHPNRLTPYEDINGLLLEYYSMNYGVGIKLTATKIEHMAVDLDKIKIPKEYEKVEIDVLYSEISELFDMIK